jgi:hypothetical protein
MLGPAHITSLDSLKVLRAALVKFKEESEIALTEVECEVERTHVWLEREQISHWQRQHKRRTELVARARADVERKLMQPTVDGGKPSTIDEVRALKRAQAAVEEAEQKIRAVKHWSQALTREMVVYKGQSGPLAGATHRDVPQAVALVDRMLEALEGYLAIEAPQAVDLGALASTIMASSPDIRKDDEPVGSMRRGGGDEPAPVQREAATGDETTEPGVDENRGGAS